MFFFFLPRGVGNLLKFASYSVRTSTTFLCCRIGSHSQHCAENLVMYVKDDTAAGSAC